MQLDVSTVSHDISSTIYDVDSKINEICSESIPFIPIYTDLDGNILKASNEASRLFKCSLPKLLKSNFFDLLSTTSLGCIWKRFPSGLMSK